MEFQDYYKTLGVERNATAAQIKSAYRKLARKHHPDVNPNNKQSEQLFKQANEAYQVLTDPEKRKKYDELGADWERGAAEEELRKRYAAAEGAGRRARTAESADFSDFFESFFGGGTGGFGGFAGGSGRGGRGGASGFRFTHQPQRAPDSEAEVPITLEEAVHGGKKRVQLTALDECEQCQGQGVIFQEETQGNTRIVRAAQNCPRCGGSGVIQNRRTLEITIPPGSEDGTRMRLAGQGGRGVRPDLNGDLYITLRIQPHRVFTLQVRDIKCILPVWDYEAVFGAEVTAPTVGSRLVLKIPAASQTGRTLRLKGKGLPARSNRPAGDMLYELRVLAPLDLTDDERKLMAELAESRNARHVPDPRAELLKS